MFAFRKLRSSRTTFLFKNISFQYLLAVTSITFQTPVAYITAKSFSIPTGLCKPGMTAPVSTLEFHLWIDPSHTMHSGETAKLFNAFIKLLFTSFIGQLRNQNPQNAGRKMSCSMWGGAKNSRMSSGGRYDAWRSKHRLRCSSHPLSHHPERKGCLRRWARTHGLRHERCEGVAGKESYWEIVVSSRTESTVLWPVNYINHNYPERLWRIWTETSMKNNYGTVVDDATSRTQYRVVRDSINELCFPKSMPH